ncbi:unnamed protein product, partial [Closterium sp. NIES-54]
MCGAVLCGVLRCHCFYFFKCIILQVFALRKLLPTTIAYDFNIHIMDFEPWEFLNVK